MQQQLTNHAVASANVNTKWLTLLYTKSTTNFVNQANQAIINMFVVLKLCISIILLFYLQYNDYMYNKYIQYYFCLQKIFEKHKFVSL